MHATQQNDRVLHLDFPGLKQRTAIGVPPAGEDTYLAKSVFAMVEEVASLDEAITRAEKAGSLTPAGMVQHTADLRERVTKIVEQRAQDYAQRRQSDAARREKLFAVPQLDPTDAAGAARDAEIRTRLAALPKGNQRDSLLAAMGSGERDDLLHALLRDPFPTPESQMAVGTWRARIEWQQRTALQTIDASAAEAEWGQSAVGAMRHVLDKSAPFVDRPARPTDDLTHGATA